MSWGAPRQALSFLAGLGPCRAVHHKGRFVQAATSPTAVRVTDMADQSPARAQEIARHLLAEALPGRWVHTQGVAAQARAVGPVLGWDTDLIEAAAWLHDIGYAPALAVTGFHPLDGARYLRTGATPPRRCARSWRTTPAPWLRPPNAA